MKTTQKFSIGTAVIFCLTLCLLAPSMQADTLYTTTNAAGPNAVVAFDLDSNTGFATFKALYPTGGVGNPNTVRSSQASIVADHGFLFVANPGSNDISVFRIKDNGALDLVASPTPSGGLQPVSLAVSRGILFVANQGNAIVPANYTGFSVRHGVLDPIPNSTVQLTTTGRPSQVLFSKNGNLLLGARPADNTIDAFEVSRDEQVTITRSDLLTGQQALGAFALAWNPEVKDQLQATLARVPGSASYHVSREGKVQFLAEGADPGSHDACWLIVRQDGNFLWLSGFFESGISMHQIAADGSLTFLSKHDSSTFGQFSTFLATDENQKVMYELTPGTNNLHVMQITGATTNGGLSDMQTVDVPQSSSPIGLVVVSNSDSD